MGGDGLLLAGPGLLWPVMLGAGRVHDHKMSVLSQLQMNQPGQWLPHLALPGVGRAGHSQELMGETDPPPSCGWIWRKVNSKGKEELHQGEGTDGSEPVSALRPRSMWKMA